eukprot:6314867-Alexandrium_andersonii.AAC.1
MLDAPRPPLPDKQRGVGSASPPSHPELEDAQGRDDVRLPPVFGRSNEPFGQVVHEHKASIAAERGGRSCTLHERDEGTSSPRLGYSGSHEHDVPKHRDLKSEKGGDRSPHLGRNAVGPHPFGSRESFESLDHALRSERTCGSKQA